jgi:hypothetical protein
MFPGLPYINGEQVKSLFLLGPEAVLFCLFLFFMPICGGIIFWMIKRQSSVNDALVETFQTIGGQIVEQLDEQTKILLRLEQRWLNNDHYISGNERLNKIGTLLRIKAKEKNLNENNK